MAHIVIGADLVPTASNIQDFEKRRLHNLVDEDIEKIIRDSDFSCFNLETPLISGDEKCICKWGPCIGASTTAISGIKAMGIDFFTLANNHIMDYGVRGLYSTIEALKKVDIQYSGVGENVNEARKMFYTFIDGKKIGIYCCAEHEFSIATANSMGANPYDPLSSFDDIEMSKVQDKADFVIVLYHGGKEHYRYPSPELQKVCHKFIDKGADLIVCQHSHCVGCKEIYRDGTIVYGQGNFIFDYDETDECWQTAILLDINISNKSYSIDFLPLVRKKKKTCLAKNEEAADIIDSFERRSREILTPDFVYNHYREYAEKQDSVYLGSFVGHKTIFFRFLNKITKGVLLKRRIRSSYRKKDILCLRNFIECEAHRELILTLLNRDESR